MTFFSRCFVLTLLSFNVPSLRQDSISTFYFQFVHILKENQNMTKHLIITQIRCSPLTVFLSMRVQNRSKNLGLWQNTIREGQLLQPAQCHRSRNVWPFPWLWSSDLLPSSKWPGKLCREGEEWWRGEGNRVGIQDSPLGSLPMSWEAKQTAGLLEKSSWKKFQWSLTNSPF